jgi:hypothetical protein
MPFCQTSTAADPCILEGVRPFLAELQTPVALQVVGTEHRYRSSVEQFIHHVFRDAYDADIQSFYPTLLSFSSGNRQRAAVGFRDGMVKPLFSEHYLPRPADKMIAAHTGNPIQREQLVEVGNLALSGAGEARWVIAAVTQFLYELGYRWVLFTAVKPLFNAFQRLGLNPIQLAEADASRLPNRGQNWGQYYDSRPIVCVGNIESGYRKLAQHVSPRQPMLHTMLREVSIRAGLNRDIPQAICGGMQ